MSDKNNKFSISVEGLAFTFTKELTIGEELALIGRRSALCDGQYDKLKFSTDPEEMFGSITANRIATLETHLDTPPDKEFYGFGTISSELLAEIWKEFAPKAGLFLPKVEEGIKEPKKSTKKSSNPRSSNKSS